ncbi:fucolectin-1-like, partial [Pempheris klunzingeri]|uniref:fucolectin-1-like n=1 Tax=Pempheris klunzingeri TaxID=3127111 RepID=UPI0039818A4E
MRTVRSDPHLATSLPNVAPNGTASQSSLWDLGDAWRAIDGNRNPNYFDGSCSHTLSERTVWWSLLLPATYRITFISITSRDEIRGTINNATILIGNDLENNGNNNPRCAIIPSIPPRSTRTFHCQGMIGRLVNVLLSDANEDRVLIMCEVEVYGEPAAPAPSFSAAVMGRSVAVVERKLCWSDALFYCRDFY